MKFSEIRTQSDLPTDLPTLQVVLWSAICELRDVSEKYALLRKSVFGRKTEKQTIAPDVQTCMEGLLEQIVPRTPEKQETVVTVKAHQRRKKHPGRNAIPENIPVVRHVLDVPEAEKSCCGCPQQSACGRSELPVIEEVERTVIEREPARYTRHVYIRLKRACPVKKDRIVVVEPPLVTPVPKALAGLSLLIFVMLSKYLYHLPLYRVQRQIYHESQIWFTRSTMVGWIRQACGLLHNVYAAMCVEVKSGRYIHGDESPVKRLEAGGCKDSFMWVYVGAGNRVAVYDYRKGRSGDAAVEFLTGCSPGMYLMSDDLAGYGRAAAEHGLLAMICMVHVRRQFVEAAEVGSHAEYAREVIRQIGRLYRLEALATKWNYENNRRLEARQRISAPIMSRIRNMLLEPGFVVLPASRIGAAISYALKNWDRACRFLEGGDLPIDNNIDERTIRPLTIGRKNWQFIASEAGGRCMAILYSIIETCKLNGINFEEYLGDVLMRLAMRPSGARAPDLTPVEWLKAKNAGKLPALAPLYPSLG